MSTQVIVTLADPVYERAERLARLTGRPLDALLSDAIDSSLTPFDASAELSPVGQLSDTELLAVVDMRMTEEQDERLSELLAGQREAELDPGEQTELAVLMGVYQAGTLRKAYALAEAVRRGLRPPLGP